MLQVYWLVGRSVANARDARTVFASDIGCDNCFHTPTRGMLGQLIVLTTTLPVAMFVIMPVAMYVTIPVAMLVAMFYTDLDISGNISA